VCESDEVVPVVSFSRVKRWYRLAQGKYEERYFSGLPEEYARQQLVREHERTVAKEETTRHCPKNVAIDDVQTFSG
jgi:hypothetical protein